MRFVSCKRSIFLSLVAMVVTLVACSGAFADAFNGITANPTSATVGTTVSISFQANLTQQSYPTVTVNGHSATPVGNFQMKYFNYSYTVASNDPGGYATIYVSGYGGSTTNTTALQIIETVPPTFTCEASPSLAKVGTTVSLTVNASEALQFPATVGIYDYRDGTYEYANWVSTNGNTYTYTYTVQSTDPEGTAIVTIWGCDLSNNWGNNDTYPYFVDMAAPTFTCQGSPSTVMPGNTVYLCVEASETVQYPPTVGVFDWRDSTYEYVNYYATSGNLYYYTYQVKPNDPPGTAIVTVWGCDQAGNWGNDNTYPYFVYIPE